MTKTKAHLVDCPQCGRVVDIGPMSTDLCAQRKCGIVFNVQARDGIAGTNGVQGDGMALRSAAQPVAESTLVNVEINTQPTMSRVELIARGICKRMGLDPDCRVTNRQPQIITATLGSMLYAAGDEGFPLWEAFVMLAKEALAEAKGCT